MSEEAMKTDRDPDRGDQVHEQGDREDRGADQAAGEEDDGDDGGEEGDHDRAEVGAFLDLRHFTHLRASYAYLGDMY